MAVPRKYMSGHKDTRMFRQNNDTNFQVAKYNMTRLYNIIYIYISQQIA